MGRYILSWTGKTSLLLTKINESFPTRYEDLVTQIETYNIPLMVDKNSVNLKILDLAGVGEFDCFRFLEYPATNVILLCFSVICESSFQSVYEIWYKELLHYCPKTPIVLVGTKIDLRNDEEEIKKAVRMITYKEGKKLAKKIGALKYLECSAKTMEGVDAVFEEIGRAVLPTKLGKSEKIKSPFANIYNKIKKSLK
jgi:small GTP-binding protein